jgi:cyclophilin family peptidyl-prolyl cis-trans isomerase/HEAT repeat protein
MPPPAAVRLAAEEVEQVAQLLRMEDARLLDTALVAWLLHAGAPEVRGRAALAAGRIRDRRATPLLLRAAEDPDAGVRARAAFALGELADSAAHIVAVLSALSLGRDVAPAREAAAALGRIGVPAGRPALEALLTADHTPAPVREAALLAAWRLPRATSTTTAVEGRAAHPDPETRWRAVHALGRMGGAEVVPALVAGLADPDDRIRAHAARGLRPSVVDSAGARPAALAALIEAAADAHPHVRISALRLLPGYRQPDSTTPILLDRLRDDDANVAMAAAQALGENADPAAAAALRSVALDAARPGGLRSAALLTWARLDAAGAAPVASAWADSAHWLLRYHAARALGAAGWQHAAQPLQGLARDPHPLVSAEALGAIRTAADSAAHPRQLYVERLGAAHPLVRAAAARALERSATPADLDLLLHAYERAWQDSIRDAAIAAVDALGALVRAGTPVHRAFFARFGERGPPADAAVRRAIERRIGTPPAAWSAPPARPDPRPLAFYREVVQRLVAPALAGESVPHVAIVTPHGEIVLELAAADAPLTVHNFLSLIDRGYYTGTRWHRVVPNFVSQDGDPRGDGSGGPGYAIRDEINMLRYDRGVLGMALSGPDTGGSQFFITHSPQPHLDGGYTVFGRVLSGMAVLDRVVQDEPILGFRRLQQ